MKSFNKTIFLMTAGLILSGCSSLNIFGGDDEKPLPGERISVLEIQDDLSPVSAPGNLPAVQIPDPWMNEFWPQRGGYPNHAMQNLALGAPSEEPVWTASIGRGGTDRLPLTAQPIIVGGKAFTLDSDSEVRAFNIKDGAQIWARSTQPENEDEAAIGGGISFGEGRLYVTSGYGEILALDPKQGDVLWRKRLSSPARAAPTVLDGRVYVKLLNNALMTLEAANGTEIWRYNAFTESAGLLGAASPAVTQNLVVAAFSSGEITGLRPETGAVAWSDTLAPRKRLGGMSSLSDVVALPVIDQDLVIGIGFGGRMGAFDPGSGARVWQQEIGSMETPLVAGNHIYVATTEHQLVSLLRDTGQVRWITDLQEFSEGDDLYWSGPVMGGGRLILASSEGRILEFSPHDGSLLREYQAPGAVSIAPVIAGQSLYVLSDNGRLAAYR